MDTSLLSPLLDIMSLPLIPYVIILINFALFNLLRRLVSKIIVYYQVNRETTASNNYKKQQSSEELSGKLRLAKLFADELISTCELCADCAELNVVYERQGSLAYGLVLFLLTYLWMDSFGDAHTSPGYLVEDYFLVKGNEMLRTGDTYARFVGQSVAMPLAWRLASFYWKYRLLSEHSAMLISENCKSSLSTSTLNGFLIEFGCCVVCRLLELFGHRLLERQVLSKRLVSLASAFVCTLLVVLALELSGGYFNPVLAASLEYGCKGINFQQHALVFWLGPLLGHLLARRLFRGLASEAEASPRHQKQRSAANKRVAGEQTTQRRLTRSSSHKRKQQTD